MPFGERHAKLDVHVAAYFLQRMKTKWGNCNHVAGYIRLNMELAKNPKDLVEQLAAVKPYLIYQYDTTVNQATEFEKINPTG